MQKMGPVEEIGRNLVSKHQPIRFTVRIEDEQADAGRGGRTRLARPNSQARTRTGKYSFSCSAYHEQGWQRYPIDPYSPLCDDHTYI